MAEQVQPSTAVRLLRRLGKDRELRRETVATTGLSPQMALLRTWQSDRLRLTYADFLSNPQSAPACNFFQNEIYAPKDFSQRDHDAERFYNLLQRFIPEPMLWLVKEVVELNQLTARLDAELLEVLVDQLGVVDQITAEKYAQAYRICDNYAERREQIERVVAIGYHVATGARNPLVLATLRAATQPARRAGWQELHDFLEKGCLAFKQLRDVDGFMNAIYTREIDLLDQIFAADLSAA